MSLSDNFSDINYDNCRLWCGQRVYKEELVKKAVKELKERLRTIYGSEEYDEITLEDWYKEIDKIFGEDLK